jgi:hypothetical protein
MNKKNIILYFLIAYSVCCFLALNRHSNTSPGTYHSEIWADKAGYNVYLPALFIYDYDASKFPEGTEKHIGYGFTLDSVSHKVITKYPYGLALMQSPFWLVAHFISPHNDGFSLYYQKAIDFAGSFYLTLGLFFLFFTINRYRNIPISIMLSILIALSTGIFYYGIYETGMSHIYSFCCMSIILFLGLNPQKTTRNILLLAFTSALYIIIRPLNAVFLIPLVLMLFMNGELTLWKDIFKSYTPKTFIISVLTISLLILPQLLYYHYAYGSFVTNSYQNEPFFFPSLSRITELLFSPNNGLFIYYPILLIVLLHTFFIKSSYNKLSLLLILTYVLIYASWWSLSLGCSFGHRAINDIVILFFMPFIISKKRLSKFLVISLIMCSLINLKFIFSYDTCLHTSMNWDFAEYKAILFGEFK